MSLFDFEDGTQPLAPPVVFVGRVTRNLVVALLIVSASLSIGMAGYHFTEGLSWLDSFVNASMILGGMGPVDKLATEGGKIFAGCYALFSGVVLLFSATLLLAPIAHRVVRAFHLADDDKQ